MVLTRRSRSLVASITAVVLLLCQAAFAAQACAHPLAAASTESSAAAPCHDAPAESPTPATQLPTPTVCATATALPDAAKVPVFALADLPAVAVGYETVETPARAGLGQQTVQAVCYSPPLSILHCRFLN